MSENTHRDWHAAQLANQTPYVQVLLRTGMTDRYFGLGRRPDIGEAALYFDASVDFDADVYFNGGFVAAEVSARLLAISALEESFAPSAADVLSAYGQSQRSTLWFELDNGDREMSKLVGQEYLLNQEVIVEITYPGLEPSKALQKFRGKVMRYALTKRALRIEVETL